MKDGWDYSEYINYLNHFFLQRLVDVDFLLSDKSAAEAVQIGDDNA